MTIEENPTNQTARTGLMAIDVLVKFQACNEARHWSAGMTLKVAWRTCPRADWLLWLGGRLVDRKKLVLAACKCARTALKFIPAGEDRPLKAIETAERWIEGKATIEEVRSVAAVAADAAYADAYAAYAAYAAAYAAYADAAYAAYAAYADAAYAAYAAAAAADAAADAAYADAAYAAYADAAYAAYAADADAAADAADAAAADAADAARKEKLAELAAIVREVITEDDIEAAATGGQS
jgi:hypothetical protein